MLPPLILGHNAFIGVDHLSQDRARDRAARFSDTGKILEVIRYAVELGVNGVMFSTHPRVRAVMKEIKKDDYLCRKLEFYPILPYAQGYVQKANEKGLVGMVLDSLGEASFSNKLKVLAKGGLSVARRDICDILTTLIDVELMPFQGLNIKAVFLHNILTDLALAMELEDIFHLYESYIGERYQARPAFATMNFPRLAAKTCEWGLEKQLIMASFNKIGFQMNPSRQACEAALRDYPLDLLAMSTLASGHLPPDEAYEYLFSLPQVNSVVVGTSSCEHLVQAYQMVNRCRGERV